MSNTVKRNFPVVGMGCAACVARVEGTLKSQDGVKACSVSLAANSAQVEYDPSIIKASGLKKAVQDAGYDLMVQEGDDDDEEDHPDEDQQHGRCPRPLPAVRRTEGYVQFRLVAVPSLSFASARSLKGELERIFRRFFRTQWFQMCKFEHK